MKLLCQKKGNTTSKVVSDNTGLERVFPWELTAPVNPNSFAEPVVNWGTTIGGPLLRTALRDVYNAPENVAAAVNKVATFEFANAAGLRVVPYTRSFQQAKEWFESNRTVYCRTLSAASGAKGLHIASKNIGTSLKKSKLYTLFCKSTFEVRVFVASTPDMPGLVLVKRRLSSEKLAEMGLEKANFWIRNLENGWVFLLPEPNQQAWCTQLVPIAREYLHVLGLEFGAVELLVVLDNGLKSWRLVEVNTAPGLIRQETIDWITNLINLYKGESA